MAQLSTAGGLISTLLAPEPMRFTATGAGAPHCSCLTGSDTSTSAAMGASSRTHSRKAAITWASDHTSGFGGSACAASGGLGSGARRQRRLLRLGLRDGGGLVRGGVRRLGRRFRCGWARRLLGGTLFRLGRRLAFHARPAGGKLEGGIGWRAFRDRYGLGVHDLDRRGRRPRFSCADARSRVVRQDRERREPQDSGDRKLVRHGDDRPGKGREQFRSICHACLGYPAARGDLRQDGGTLWWNCGASSCAVSWVLARSVAGLAGAEGIEPSHGGIKIRCRKLLLTITENHKSPKSLYKGLS